MATNNFKPFATAANANVTAQADWETLPALLSGFTAGKASSAQVNKAIRQASFIAAALAQYTANKSGLDVLDDGDLNGFIAKMSAAFGKDFQALDATLTALAGLTTGANKLPYFNGNDTAALTDLTQVGRDIVGKSTIADILTYLGLEESAFGYKNMVVFSNPGVMNWVVPDELRKGRKCYVKIIGGGGSGGRAAGGGGGGGGGIAEKLIDLTEVESVTLTVGNGGIAPAAGTSNIAGTNGGTTSFGSILSATGGTGGATPSGGACGVGIGGDFNTSLGPGNPGSSFSTSFVGGGGGGPGGQGAVDTSMHDGLDAYGPGGGGAGAALGAPAVAGRGGKGGNGVIIIRW